MEILNFEYKGYYIRHKEIFPFYTHIWQEIEISKDTEFLEEISTDKLIEMGCCIPDNISLEERKHHIIKTRKFNCTFKTAFEITEDEIKKIIDSFKNNTIPESLRDAKRFQGVNISVDIE